MKLICISPQEDKPSIIYQKPDTALLRNNEAFYMPEFSKNIRANITLVIKVKKLGKRIAERFAYRYYDEITAGLNIEASDLLEENIKSKLPWDSAVAFDQSAPIGRFISTSDQLKLELIIDKKETTVYTIDTKTIDHAISEVSNLFTLKIGDLIYLTIPQDSQQLEIGQHLSANLNGEELLRCNIK